METDTRMARLPKWAQDEIQRLENSNAYLRKKLEAGPEDSNTFVQSHTHPSTPLGESPTIRFVLSDEDEWIDIEVTPTESSLSELTVRCNSNSGRTGRIAVLPVVSKVIIVRAVP